VHHARGFIRCRYYYCRRRRARGKVHRGVSLCEARTETPFPCHRSWVVWLTVDGGSSCSSSISSHVGGSGGWVRERASAIFGKNRWRYYRQPTAGPCSFSSSSLTRRLRRRRRRLRRRRPLDKGCVLTQLNTRATGNFPSLFDMFHERCACVRKRLYCITNTVCA